jgi:hypothetical protein
MERFVHVQHRKYLGAVAVCAALVLSACGASGGSDSSKDTTTKPKGDTTTTKPEATTTAASADDAKARAETVDLTVSDFPDGWSATPSSDDDSGGSLKDCVPSLADESKVLAKHTTDTFLLGSLDNNDGSQFSAKTGIFDSAADAAAVVTDFKDPTVVSCINTAIKTQFASGGQYTVDGSVAPVSDLDLGTDDIAGIGGDFTLTASDGTSVKASVADVMMSTGDVLTQATLLTVGTSLDSSTLNPTVQKLAELNKAA